MISRFALIHARRAITHVLLGLLLAVAAADAAELPAELAPRIEALEQEIAAAHSPRAAEARVRSLLRELRREQRYSEWQGPLGDLGDAWRQRARSANDLNLAHAAVAVQRVLRNDARMAAALVAQADVESVRIGTRASIRTYNAALKLARRAGAKGVEAVALTNLAVDLHASGKTVEALAQDERALALARAGDDKPSEALVLLHLGSFLATLQRHVESRDRYAAALALAAETGDPDTQARAQAGLASAFTSLRDYQSALSAATAAVALNRKTESRSRLAAALDTQGDAFYNLGRYEESLAPYREALQIYTELGPRQKEFYELLQVATSERELGHIDAAGELFRRAAAGHVANGDPVRAVEPYRQLGLMLAKAGRRDASLAAFADAQRLAQSAKDAGAEADVLAGRADADFGARQFAQAVTNRTAELQIRRKLQNPKKTASCLFALGDANDNLDQPDEAQRNFEESARFSREARDLALEGMTYTRIGNIHYNRKDYRRAMPWYDKALAIDVERGDRVSEAVNLGNAANTLDLLDDNDKSIQYDERAIAIYRDLKMEPELARKLRNVAVTMVEVGRLEDADRLLTEALALLRKIGDDEQLRDVLSRLGRVKYQFNESAAAIALFRESLASFERAGDRKAVSLELTRLANAYSQAQMLADALATYEAAIKVDIELNDSAGEVTDRIEAAGKLSALNRHADALKTMAIALEVARRSRNGQGESLVLATVGQVHASAGRLDLAESSFQQALQVAKANDDESGAAGRYNDLGNLAYRRKQYQQAAGYYAQARTLHHKLQDQRNEAIDAENASNTWYALKDYSKSLELDLAALELYRATRNRRAQGLRMHSIALTYQDLQQSAESLQYFQQALPLLREFTENEKLYELLPRLGELLRTTGNDPAGAAELLAEAVRLHEANGNRTALARDLTRLGEAFEAAGKHADGLAAFQRAVEIDHELKDSAGAAYDLHKVGAMQLALSRNTEALASFRAALALRQKLDDRFAERRPYLGIGDAAMALEHFADAEAAYAQALRISRAANKDVETSYDLTKHGEALRALRRYDEALADFEAGLEIDQRLQSRGDLTVDYQRIADIHADKKDIAKAVENYQIAIALQRELTNAANVATLLASLGDVYHNVAQDYASAVRNYREAAQIRQQLGKDESAAYVLKSSGNSNRLARHWDESLADYQAALQLFEKVGNRRALAELRSAIGDLLNSQYRFADALQSYLAGLEIAEALAAANNGADAASVSGLLSNAYTNVGLMNKKQGLWSEALRWYQKALDFDTRIGDRNNIRIDYGTIVDVYSALGDYQKALQLQERVVAGARELARRDAEVTASIVYAWLLSSVGRAAEGLPLVEQAVATARQIPDRSLEAAALAVLASTKSELGQLRPALAHNLQALAILRELKSEEGIAAHLLRLCDMYRSMAQYGDAFASCQQSLDIRRSLGDPDAENDALIGIGNNYYSVGKYNEAIDYYQRALDIAQKLGQKNTQAIALGNIGATLNERKEAKKALPYIRQSVALFRETGNRASVARNLGNLADVLLDLGQTAAGLREYDNAIAIQRQVGDRVGEGSTLTQIAKAQEKTGKLRRAVTLNQQAMEIALETESPSLLATVWQQLGSNYEKLGRTEQSIFYRKQAVNTYQQMRASAMTLAKDFQQSLAKEKEPVYRALAGQLIARGRLPEAEQVMAMLKEEEYFDFVRRDAGTDARTTAMPLTAGEQPWTTRYREISARLAALGAEFQVLSRIAEPSPEQDSRYKALDADLKIAREAFQAYLADLENAFKSQSTERAMDFAALDTASLAGLQGELADMGEGTVVVHYLIVPDQVHILLTTAGAPIHRESSIRQDALYSLIFQYREILQSPNKDPLPTARQLYKVLIEPIEADLAQARAKVLMLSLDGVLRYLPFGALHDGRQYLTQRYGFALYTPAARAALQRKPSGQWRIAGLGVSQAAPSLQFAALPAVPVELDEIIRDGDQDQAGVLSGSVSLDDKFTAESFSRALRTRPPVVHIASHFNFTPGTEVDSFLLLGAGNKLSLADFKSGNYPLNGVELLTLSACQTALGDVGQSMNAAAGGGKATGKEVEGFGALAQQRGAGAVMATLWSVADGSTGLFMREFYRLHETEKLTKAEAMRRVQVGFISGELRPDTAPVALRGAMRPPPSGAVAAGIAKVAKYTPDPKAPFAHPFFWAPFILMGNWL